MNRDKFIFLVVFFFVLIIGFFISNIFVLSNTEQKNLSKTAQKVTAAPTESPSKELLWDSFKNVDDRMLSECGTNFSIVSDIFTAQSKLDFDTVASKNAELERATKVANDLAEQRNQILTELGY